MGGSGVHEKAHCAEIQMRMRERVDGTSPGIVCGDKGKDAVKVMGLYKQIWQRYLRIGRRRKWIRYISILELYELRTSLTVHISRTPHHT
jgi:hypothetical protein